MSEVNPVPPAPPKSDPETLALRASPGPIIRFRRGVIVGLAASVSVAIAAISWLALQPPGLRLAAQGDGATVTVTGTPEALAGAPDSYGEVPRLGPPLPGDLGRPILARQRELEAAGEGMDDSAGREDDLRRQREAAEELSARQSGVMMQLAGTSGSTTPTADPAAGMAAQGLTEGPVTQAAVGQSGIAETLGRENREATLNPHRLMAAPSPWTLMAGSVIAASLVTGLNSDLPGFVIAQVTENAYDSVTGRTLLVPQGSRLVGRYEAVVAFGQSRALVVWQRIILPDGSSIQIDNMPATDTAGHAGLSDRIDRHTWQLLKGVALSTLLGVGTELGFGSSEGDLVRAIRESAQQSGARAGDRLVSRNLDIQPTLRVRPGWPLRVVVHKDVVLRPWGGANG